MFPSFLGDTLSTGECSLFEDLWNASIAIQELWPPVVGDSGKDPNNSMIGYENMKPKRMQKLSFLMKTISNQPTTAFSHVKVYTKEN
ncbi:hypothetical protein M513_09800 [Trichuris suis]|uniref:Uncharacterized protein n=1 Tax=Trichuris suis TaxID=68888 RepID=A0A085LWK7_9BILA|nr:hypothetical protein M513_09800 [Trichuris suis]